jgi:hypothetical protein
MMRECSEYDAIQTVMHKSSFTKDEALAALRNLHADKSAADRRGPALSDVIKETAARLVARSAKLALHEFADILKHVGEYFPGNLVYKMAKNILESNMRIFGDKNNDKIARLDRAIKETIIARHTKTTSYCAGMQAELSGYGLACQAVRANIAVNARRLRRQNGA